MLDTPQVISNSFLADANVMYSEIFLVLTQIVNLQYETVNQTKIYLAQKKQQYGIARTS